MAEVSGTSMGSRAVGAFQSVLVAIAAGIGTAQIHALQHNPRPAAQH